jgi:hypothetical protein
MIFALATDDKSLLVFHDAMSAIAYCEGIDVEDGVWNFWGSGGEALEPVFSQPNERTGSWVSNGAYSLQPSAKLQDLLASLDEVGHLEPNPYFSSLAAVAEHLAQSSRLHQHRA